MLRKLKTLFAGNPSIADISADIRQIDISSLQAALATARQRRAELLLDGTVEQILAAERAIDTARIELERGEASLAELERRKAEAEAKAAADALVKRRADAQAKVDAVVARIESEYPRHARAIAELAALAHEADAAADEWFESYLKGDTFDLPAIDPVGQRVGWKEKYFRVPPFADGPSLPAVGDFPGYGEAEKWLSPEAMYAVYGSGSAPA